MNQGGIIYEKYIKGDILTDEEVSAGISIFKAASDSCIKCGPVFSLAFKEANSVYMRMLDIKEARKGRYD